MNVYKLEKQDELAGLSYQPGQQGLNEPNKAIYFDTLENAEGHLSANASVDPSKVLNGPFGRVYKSHVGTFVVTEIPVITK